MHWHVGEDICERYQADCVADCEDGLELDELVAREPKFFGHAGHVRIVWDVFSVLIHCSIRIMRTY